MGGKVNNLIDFFVVNIYKLLSLMIRNNQTGMAEPDVRPPGAASPNAKSI